MSHRTYVIIDAADVPQVDFSEVLETSEDTLRWSVDESQTFVKFEGATPDFLDGKTQYNHAEILAVLAGPDWTQPNLT
mgnify:FL=1|tara:strand:+ start:4686 stop:4919 length:234 start_codon:yes stop_codon:yes gene_type:complete